MASCDDQFYLPWLNLEVGIYHVLLDIDSDDISVWFSCYGPGIAEMTEQEGYAIDLLGMALTSMTDVYILDETKIEIINKNDLKIL